MNGEKEVTISATADELLMIRAGMASVDVQIDELKEALESHQKHVRAALLSPVDGRES